MSSPNAKTTLITVPHRCVIYRWFDPGCDKNAKRFASIVHAIVKPSVLFLGNTPRMFCDLTRKRCRRNDIRNRIRASLGPNTRLFDIHTFPYGAIPWFPDMQIGVMFQKDRRYLADALSAKFRQCKLPLRWYTFGGGTTENDIIHEALGHGVDALLIELADNLTVAQVALLAECLHRF